MTEAVAEILTSRRIEAASVESSISAADLDRLRKASRMRLRTIAAVVEAARTVKDSDEIAAISKACNLAAAAFKKARQEMSVGMTESELAGILELHIRRKGAKPAFDTIAAFGPNASRPHHSPDSRKLKRNDTILVDFGIKWAGYNSDLTRCLEVGRPNRQYQAVFGTVEKAQAAAISLVRPGISLQQVDQAARRVIRESGLPVYGHGTGHGLGLEVHEGPLVAATSKGSLQPGNVVTIEPGVYLPGEVGVRIEDDVLVTDSGCRILSRRCPH
jgi:Xaa-Pro aminopeptidase